MDQSFANIASQLLKIKAVKLSPENPFTWASGLRSPIYCDNRKTLSYPETRNAIREQFASIAKSEFPDIVGIAGVATAGIAHGALLADELNLPFIYIRSSPKGHGLENLIEGELIEGGRYLVVEDAVSTGKSSMKAMVALKEAGAEVAGMLCIFNYMFDQSVNLFAEAGIKVVSLATLANLLTQAVEFDYLDAAQEEELENWRKDPKAWSQSFLETIS